MKCGYMVDWGIQLYNWIYQYNFYLCPPFPTSCCCSSLDPTTKDGALGLLANLGQPVDILAPTGPSWVGASMVPLLVCPETRHSSSRKCDKLSFTGLLVNNVVLHHITQYLSFSGLIVNLAVLHHVSVIVIICCWVLLWSERASSRWCGADICINTLFGDSTRERLIRLNLGAEYLFWLYFVAEFNLS